MERKIPVFLLLVLLELGVVLGIDVHELMLERVGRAARVVEPDVAACTDQPESY